MLDEDPERFGRGGAIRQTVAPSHRKPSMRDAPSATGWPAALGRRGIVACPHPLATRAALDALGPAIRHAADGIVVSPGQARVTARATDLLGRAREPAFRRFATTYLADGAAQRAGASLVQGGLARTLERLARAGGRVFYEGE